MESYDFVTGGGRPPKEKPQRKGPKRKQGSPKDANVQWQIHKQGDRKIANASKGIRAGQSNQEKMYLTRPIPHGTGPVEDGSRHPQRSAAVWQSYPSREGGRFQRNLPKTNAASTKQ